MLLVFVFCYPEPSEVLKIWLNSWSNFDACSSSLSSSAFKFRILLSLSLDYFAFIILNLLVSFLLILELE